MYKKTNHFFWKLECLDKVSLQLFRVMYLANSQPVYLLCGYSKHHLKQNKMKTIIYVFFFFFPRTTRNDKHIQNEIDCTGHIF